MRNTDGQFGLKHCDWEKGEQTFHPVQIKQIVQHYNLLVYFFLSLLWYHAFMTYNMHKHPASFPSTKVHLYISTLYSLSLSLSLSDLSVTLTTIYVVYNQ